MDWYERAPDGVTLHVEIPPSTVAPHGLGGLLANSGIEVITIVITALLLSSVAAALSFIVRALDHRERSSGGGGSP